MRKTPEVSPKLAISLRSVNSQKSDFRVRIIGSFRVGIFLRAIHVGFGAFCGVWMSMDRPSEPLPSNERSILVGAWEEARSEEYSSSEAWLVREEESDEQRAWAGV